MKRFAIFCALCLMLTGCNVSTETVEQPLVALDTANVAQNTEQIEQLLNENLWSYDKDSISLGNDFIISATGENFNAICAASQQAGIDTTNLEKGAEQSMLASVNLLNSDRTSAGTAYFAFSGSKLLCGYYTYNNGYYSLKNKYPFEYKNPFSAFENKENKAEFTPVKKNSDLSTVADVENGAVVKLDEELATIYGGSKESGLKHLSDINFDEGVIPMDIAIGKDYNCILLGRYEKAEIISESNYEEDDESCEIIRTKSEKIVFVNDKGEMVLPELPLDLSVYTSLDFDGGDIAVARNNAVDVFTYTDNAWVKKQRIGVDNTVVRLRIDDIDGNGVNEYIVSDGVNLFVYGIDSIAHLVWSTKFDVSAIDDFFVGDLNNDGVEEIYVNDSNGFLTRYSLGENGFEVYSDEILTGERMYYAVGDIDGNGNDDYLTLNGEEVIVYYNKQ